MTVEQKPEAMEVLRTRAEEAKVRLEVLISLHNLNLTTLLLLSRDQASSFSIVPIHPELKTFKLGPS